MAQVATPFLACCRFVSLGKSRKVEEPPRTNATQNLTMTQTLKRPFVDFAGIKAAVSMQRILDYYDLTDSFTPSGADSLRGCCPIHGGDNPKQFSISLSKNCWHCFSDCQEGGNVIDFVARMEDTTVHEAALLLNEWFHLDLERKPSRKGKARKESDAKSEVDSPPDPSHEAPPSPASQPEQEKAEENRPLGFTLKNLEVDHPYFAERGLTPETVEHFGLGFCNRGTMAGRIAIPIHHSDGELVGYAGRWPGEPPEERPKYKLPKGFHKAAEVFNLHRAMEEPEGPLVVVEGFFDCFALWQVGIHRAVALMGSHLSPIQERLLLEAIPRSGQIELLFDADEAGDDAREQALRQLAPHAYVRVIPLPERGMQPDHLPEEHLVSLFE